MVCLDNTNDLFVSLAGTAPVHHHILQRVPHTVLNLLLILQLLRSTHQHLRVTVRRLHRKFISLTLC